MTISNQIFPRIQAGVAQQCRTLLLTVAIGATTISVAPASAYADLTLCNTTASRVGVAIGRKKGNEWIAEGWWNIVSNSCKTLFRGELEARFYYVHALDYDRGGEWAGKAFMCADDKAFTIKGVENCESRGYRRKGFFEVDTQNAESWTIHLSDPRDDTSDSSETSTAQ